MARRVCLLLLLIALVALPLFGLKEERGDGLVLGYDGAFKVTAPAGWIFDDESTRSDYSAVLYPAGYQWNAEETAAFISGDVLTKEGRTLEATVAAYEEGPHLELLPLVTGDGREARVRAPATPTPGTLRRVAFIDAPGVVCQVTLRASDQASFDKAVPAFEAVLKSFRFIGPDSGEFLATWCSRSILLLTSDVQNLFTYGQPKGWNEEQTGKAGVTVFKRANGKAYGIMAIYSAKPSLGSPQADYEAGWKEIAQSAFSVGPAPTPQSEQQEGCQVRVGQTSIGEDGRQSTVVLTVLSGWGKRTTLLACCNDSSIMPDIERFRKSLHAYYSLRSAAGWSNGSPRSQDYVDGKLVNLGDGGYSSRNYDFKESTYEFRGETMLDADHYVLVNETGTYFLEGNKLTLVGQGGTQRKVDRNGRATASRPLPAWRRTYTYKMVEIEQAIHGPHLVLSGVKENEVDGCFTGFFPNAFGYVRGYHPQCRFQRF